MKRDMDLIRLLLIEKESEETPEAIGSYTENQILYHCELAIESGLLDGHLFRGLQGEVCGATIQKLTWEGHEFLDAARSDSLWNQAKEKMVAAGGSWTMEGLKMILFELARRGLTGQ